jgi:segregation and condensation protein B
LSIAVSELKLIIEATLLAAGEPLSLDRLLGLFAEDDEHQPSRQELREALFGLAGDYTGRGIELAEVAGGYRIQVRQEFSSWVSRLWEDRAGRYSRAFLETLALIAYRQPITRGEIAEIRGVSVNTTTIKTLQERNWIKVIGHREVPGRPALFGTTRDFLDYFNLQSLSDLPPLSEPRDLLAIGAGLGHQIDAAEAESAQQTDAAEAEMERQPAQQTLLAENAETGQLPGDDIAGEAEHAPAQKGESGQNGQDDDHAQEPDEHA